MGADKNSLRRELGLCPEITSKCPPHVLSRSRSNHSATDPRTTQQPEHSKQAAEQTTRVQRPAPVRPVTSTGQTGQGPGHPTNTLWVTRELTETNRVTQTSTPGHLPNSCDHSQTTLHQSDRCRAPIRPVPGNLPKNRPELAQQT